MTRPKGVKNKPKEPDTSYMLKYANAEAARHRMYQDQTTGELVEMYQYPDGIWMELNRKKSRLVK